MIERAERLKVIGRAGVGVDNVDVDAATRRGIVVANAPDSTVVSAAEHTIGLLVALARNIPQAHAALKDGRWERSRWGGIELADKTLGVLGFGRIGRQVARRALGLGMRVVGYDPFVAPERFRELGAEHALDPADVFAAAEFLTLHLPLTEETRRFVDADALARMRDGVRIVNAARGELVDESALAQAVREGKVAGAALDVFSAEPYAGELLELENVVVTPHLAASTEEAQDRAGVIVAEQVVAALEGGLVTNALNIPIVGAEDLERSARYIPLAAKLGRLAVELAGGHPRRIALSFNGAHRRPRHAPADRRRAERRLPGPRRQAVNYVNAPVIAAERGIEVSEERSGAARDYLNLVTRRGGRRRGRGTTLGPEHRLYLAGALGFAIDIAALAADGFFRYDDVPGVIGASGRCSARPASTSRTWPSRGRRRRQGADGARDRLRAAASSSSGSGGGLRRCPLHHRLIAAAAAGSCSRFAPYAARRCARCSCTSYWPSSSAWSACRSRSPVPPASSGRRARSASR